MKKRLAQKIDKSPYRYRLNKVQTAYLRLGYQLLSFKLVNEGLFNFDIHLMITDSVVKNGFIYKVDKNIGQCVFKIEKP